MQTELVGTLESSAHGEAEAQEGGAAGHGHRGQKPLGSQAPVSQSSAPSTVLCSHQPPLGPLDKWSLIIYDGALQLRVNPPEHIL